MAYKNNADTEHAYKRISKELKEDCLPHLLYFFGREQYLIHWAVEAIVKQYINEACKDLDFSRLDGQTATLLDIQNNCETLSMMSRSRVVLLSEFKPIEGGKSKAMSDGEEQQLAEYLGDLPDSCILIITGTGQPPDKRKKLYKTVADKGSVYDFCDLDEKQLKSFIDKRFRTAGKVAKPSIISELIQLSGYYDKETDYTLYNLDNDIKKIIAHTMEQEIFLTDVLNTVSGNVDTNVFAMIDSLSRNRKDQVFQLLHNQLIYGESEYKLLALICSQFELILAVKEMKENGMSFDKMKTTLGIHEFRIKRAILFAERYSINHLKAILQKAYAVDKNIKTGLLESSLALEMFIAEI